MSDSISNEHFCLSGVSLIGCRAGLSGISSVELVCLATVFLRCGVAGQRACSEPSVCLRCCNSKGFVLKLQPFVGAKF